MPLKDLIDIPPVWLVLAIIVAWLQAHLLPLGLTLEGAVTDALAGLMIGAGAFLILAAALAFRRARTTILPHQTPAALITTGVFARTRNPIYLADVLILTGFILRFDAVASLVLVPIFVWWIERHFIVPEENRMRRTFRADFAAYERKVRRWV
ncbi:MAG: isoprenylcysteine carboxylmethyltransferase family protein [Tateyamaria sp.]|uniref:methyltransferase family protein n=1 Tax=Tateyamaria sp. TaxID=1929288 RepID=UPI0032906925